MEFFYLSDTGIKEKNLREYLATFGVGVRLGQHPHAAITGNKAVVSRLVALHEAGFTAKLVEHLRSEFPEEIDAIVGAAPVKGEPSQSPITPNRTRTGVFWLRTRHPRPLDDGGRSRYCAELVGNCQGNQRRIENKSLPPYLPPDAYRPRIIFPIHRRLPQS